MLKNYLKIAFRNLKKNKSYASISILGLAIGLAVCILLLLYVQHEVSYDRFHTNADHIYRLCQAEHPYHAPQVAKLLADNLPEVEKYTRILVRGEVVVQHQNNKFKETNYAFADADLFRIFSFPFKYGDPETALEQPYSIVISEETSQKYFGNENPIGKVLTLDNEADYTVGGVMENMPQNSHFRYDLIATLANADDVFGTEWMNHWGWQNFIVYFLIPNEFSRSDFELKCSQLMKNPNEPDSPLPQYSIQSLKKIHLYSSHLVADIQPQNSITYVLVFSGIALLILFIACFNYINLLTSNAMTRTHEIGIKKAIGATRKQLAMQFIGESIVVIGISFILSLIIVHLCLPTFNTLSSKSLTIQALIHLDTLLIASGIILITGVLSGCYPAFIISAFKPVNALKTSAGGYNSNFQFRKVLVGIQFTIVIALICGAILMFGQINFLKQKELGFDKEYILTADVNSFDDVEKFNTMKQALLSNTMVSSVACASRIPSGDLNNWGALQLESQNESTDIPFVHIGFDYFQTLGISTSKGRLFSSELRTDMNDAIILNQAAVDHLRMSGNPVGQILGCSWPESRRQVIGVVDNFNFESLYEKVRPTAFLIDYGECWQLMIKMKSSNPQNVVSSIQKICQTFYPDWIFEFHLLDDRLDHIYHKDNRTFQLMSYFTILAIFIASMGLFGMASFMLARRTKEIGIRKVIGASVQNITIMLCRDFTKWIVVANILAWPIAWYAMSRWLQNFAYRIDLTIWPFLLAGLTALFIALMTISWQAIRAAATNPIEALRYE